MDSSTVFYIIAVIIYFIYTSFANRKSDNSNPEMEEQEGSPSQGTSFEDLLRDIRDRQNQDKSAENEEEVLQDEKPDSTTLLSKTQRKLDDQESNSADEVEVKNTYRDIKQPLIKLDDQVDLSDGRKILGDVVDVAGEHPGGNKYARFLKNPETKKDAIVLTEIFNRKHF
jgi:hypothetical protein